MSDDKQSSVCTPALAAARAAHPGALIWVVVRKGCEGILAGCPAIDRVLVSAAPEKSKRNPLNWLDDFKLLRELRRQHFDYAFELTNGDRGRLLAAWSGARFRCANDGAARVPIFWRTWFNKISRRDWTGEHQVEANFNFVKEFLPLGVGEPPPLLFEREFAAQSALQKNLHDYIVIHPGTRWRRKRWPQEKWIEAGRELSSSRRKSTSSAARTRTKFNSPKILSPRSARRRSARAENFRGRNWPDPLQREIIRRRGHGGDAPGGGVPVSDRRNFGDTVAKHWQPWRVAHRLVLPSLPEGSQIDRAERIRHVPVSGVVAASRELLGGNSQFRIVSTSPNS